MTTTLIGRLAKLDGEIAEHETAIKKLKAKRAPIAEQALDYMSRHGIMNQKVNGRTVYVARELWASKDEDIPMPEFVALVQANGMPELASYSPQRLTSWARELAGEGEELPAWLLPHVKLSEVDKIRSRKS